MLKDGKISCILTSYNRPVWLDQAIQSVVDQTYDNWELLIMDDNSSDPQVDKTLDVYSTHKKIRIFKSHVHSLERMDVCRYAYLINEGFRAASGKYITYLTDDDYYLPKRFEIMTSKLESDYFIHIVYGWQQLQYGDDPPHSERVYTRVLDDAYDIVDHNSVMHDTELFREVGGWNISSEYWRGADGIFWRKLTNAGYKFYPVNKFTDVHRFHVGSVRHKLLEQGLTDLN
jgi:spore maturation protein CgeD